MSIENHPCPAPEGCPFGAGGACKPYGRLNVLISDDDPLGCFVFRTTGFNSIRTLIARLQYFQAISGNQLSCLPLELRLRGKSTRQSLGAPIYYVDITLRSGVTVADALLEAKRIDAERQASGFDQVALEAAVRTGLANGVFEDSEEETEAVVEEFYPESPGENSPESVQSSREGNPTASATNLGQKLEVKALALSQ